MKENHSDESAGKAYSGRWVARLRGRIVAQASTPQQARQAALSRYKEIPEIVFIPPETELILPAVTDSIITALPAGTEAYLVGGAIRDAMMGHMPHDLDFVVPAGAIKIGQRIANHLKAGYYILDAERDACRVILTDKDGIRTLVDFSSYRGSDLEEDLRGRDFTLDAIAMDVRDRSFHDPMGGIQDLKDRRLVACSPSAFRDDPVRILRGIRLAANLEFTLKPETRQEMKESAELLTTVSAERMRDELLRMLEGRKPAACILALDILGALKFVLPEMEQLKGVIQNQYHVHDAWEHTLSAARHLATIVDIFCSEKGVASLQDWVNGMLLIKLGKYRPRLSEHLEFTFSSNRSLRSILLLATLYHDIAKPQDRSEDESGIIRFLDHDQHGGEIVKLRGQLLALSNDEIQRMATIVRQHMRILNHTIRMVEEGKAISRRAIYRFFRDTGSAGIDLCLLALADVRATYEQNLPAKVWTATIEIVEALLENWFNKPGESINPDSLINGNDLMAALGLPPGKIIGELLESLREAQAMGKVSTREEAFHFLKESYEKSKSH